MDIRELIERKLLEKFELSDYSDCYIVDIAYHSSDNKVKVFMDCDSALTLEKCTIISRFLESYIDDKQILGEKYTLEVSSPGLERSLKFLRQYKKNIGRYLEITTDDDEKINGKLVEIVDDRVVLEIKEKKNIIKKTINYSNIAKAFVQIKF